MSTDIVLRQLKAELEELVVQESYDLLIEKADHMLDLGFIEDIVDIKKKIQQRHQTLFFSATINKDIKRKGPFLWPFFN